MRGSLLGLLLAALAVAPALAGCTHHSRPPLPTAKEALAVADAKIRHVLPHATLREAYSIEAGSQLRGNLAREAAPYANRKDAATQDLLALILRTESDDVPGDGRAPAWLFTYMTGDGTEELVVTRQGISLETRTSGAIAAESGSFDRPVMGWAVDSVEAFQEARQADGPFDRAVGQPDSLVFSMLRQSPQGPVWVLGTVNASRPAAPPDNGVVAVDGAGGGALPKEVLAGVFFAPVLREAGDSARVYAAAFLGPLGDSFAIEGAGHAVIAVEIGLDPPAPVPVAVKLNGPGGIVAEGQIAAGTTGRQAVVLLVTGGAPPGLYFLNATATEAATTMDLSWCTDGKDQGAAGEAVCAALAG